MQLFQILELKEFPYMTTQEILQGEFVKDILNSNNEDKVFLLIDHEEKRIWMWNGLKSSFKLQIYGGIIATKIRQQLKLFYRIYSLNIYTRKDLKYIDTLNKPLGSGKAQTITKEDFIERRYGSDIREDIIVATDINPNKAIEFINQIPRPDPNNFERKFILIGGSIFIEEEIPEKFVQEEKITKKPLKMGILNRGFTFFSDNNYSTRLIVNERKIQGLELYTLKTEDAHTMAIDLKIPILVEEKFSKQGNIEKVLNAFKIPNNLPDEDKE
jgi:hypothetical protein